MSWVTVSKSGSLLLVGLLAAAACANDESSSTNKQPTSETDTDAGSTTLDGAAPDGGSSDAGKEGGSEDAAVDADAAVPTCSKEGWCRLALPSNAGKATLVGVWGDGQGTVWAVSTEGNILRWDGTSWTVARPGTDPLYAIWGSGPTDLWVSSAAGILHGSGSSSASLAWTLTPLDSLPGDLTTTFGTIGGTSPTNIWIAGFREHNVNGFGYSVSRVLRYLGPGSNPAWALETDLSTGDTLPPDTFSRSQWTKVLGTSSGDVYVVGRARGINQPDPDLKFPASVKHRDVHPDGTAVWTEMYNSITPNWDDRTPCWWFMFNAGMPPDGRPSWFPIAAGARGNRIWLASGYNAERYAVATFDEMMSSTAWTCDAFSFGDSVARNAIWVSGENEAWSVGDFGRINHFDGTTWKIAAVTATSLPITQDLLDIWGDDHALWVVGKGIALRKLLNP
ncbi:Type IV fimbrial biogenesis protein PilY1 [Labilithrix luteola]|uniref:Type IV fimbrial biogenesis protein PilY1 n=1 Tax=Labilithrix luteola TaxID=1391654 RepID=A0A0K1PL59_9BACT|nr:hypothetical protein [Labilithrix luteola]AKU93854.1 Type IV fimbrial biogenesis protein PilY1 [Labilithrix luteola]